jgi:hypothetical protein
MFAVHVSNPFTAKSRARENDEKIMERHRNDRDVRDATRKAAWESNARQEDNNRKMAGMGGPGKKSTLADRAKFQFEADSEDDEMVPPSDSITWVTPWAASWTRRTSTLKTSMRRRTRWMIRLP